MQLSADIYIAVCIYIVWILTCKYNTLILSEVNQQHMWGCGDVGMLYFVVCFYCCFGWFTIHKKHSKQMSIEILITVSSELSLYILEWFQR